MASNDVVVGNRYRLSAKLNSGSFGTVYRGVDIQTSQPVAVKLEPIDSQAPQLEYESKVYEELHSSPVKEARIGIPRVHYYGQEGRYRILVLDLLGCSLEDLFNLCNRKFSLKTTLMIADQLFSRIQFLHSIGYLHRDIKSDNFVIGRDDSHQVVHIIDFGLAKKYKHAASGKHIPFSERSGLTGTVRYVSVGNHLGVESARRDDLESLGYLLLYFVKGSLPWQGIRKTSMEEKFDAIYKMKISLTPQQLCAGLPAEFAQFFTYVKSLAFDKKPDYMYIRRLFRTLFVKKGYVNDYQFDWSPILPSHQQLGPVVYSTPTPRLVHNPQLFTSFTPQSSTSATRFIVNHLLQLAITQHPHLYGAVKDVPQHLFAADPTCILSFITPAAEYCTGALYFQTKERKSTVESSTSPVSSTSCNVFDPCKHFFHLPTDPKPVIHTDTDHLQQTLYSHIFPNLVHHYNGLLKDHFNPYFAYQLTRLSSLDQASSSSSSPSPSPSPSSSSQYIKGLISQICGYKYQDQTISTQHKTFIQRKQRFDKHIYDLVLNSKHLVSIPDHLCGILFNASHFAGSAVQQRLFHYLCILRHVLLAQLDYIQSKMANEHGNNANQASNQSLMKTKYYIHHRTKVENALHILSIALTQFVAYFKIYFTIYQQAYATLAYRIAMNHHKQQQQLNQTASPTAAPSSEMAARGLSLDLRIVLDKAVLWYLLFNPELQYHYYQFKQVVSTILDPLLYVYPLPPPPPPPSSAAGAAAAVPPQDSSQGLTSDDISSITLDPPYYDVEFTRLQHIQCMITSEKQRLMMGSDFLFFTTINTVTGQLATSQSWDGSDLWPLVNDEASMKLSQRNATPQQSTSKGGFLSSMFNRRVVQRKPTAANDPQTTSSESSPSDGTTSSQPTPLRHLSLGEVNQQTLFELTLDKHDTDAVNALNNLPILQNYGFHQVNDAVLQLEFDSPSTASVYIEYRRESASNVANNPSSSSSSDLQNGKQSAPAHPSFVDISFYTKSIDYMVSSRFFDEIVRQTELLPLQHSSDASYPRDKSTQLSSTHDTGSADPNPTQPAPSQSSTQATAPADLDEKKRRLAAMRAARSKK